MTFETLERGTVWSVVRFESSAPSSHDFRYKLNSMLRTDFQSDPN